ncbi:hypothetical protein PTKIN_Ptkin16aG0023200 [Pterospermum kingtungense]
MAANSTLLAIQCATGVPPPRCHLPRNLVTKTPNNAIIAASAYPVVKYEAGNFLVSTPTQLHRNLVSKRDKTMVAAYPVKIEFTTDTPVSTECFLENTSGEVLKLDDKTIWEGSRAVDFPKDIPGVGVGEFKQEADYGGPVIGSVGGLEYIFGDGKYKWIIAWSNPKNEINKVYTEILEDDVVNWDQIKHGLEKSRDKCEVVKASFKSEIEIDPTSATAKVKATLKRFIIGDDGKGSPN